MKYTAFALLAAIIVAVLILLQYNGAGAARDDRTALRWATSAVGSAGHRAKIGLTGLLAREMPEFDITIMPTSSALTSIRGFTLGQFEGFYGADIAFHELAGDRGRFRGFAGRVQREPVQSFWTYTMEVGLAVHARDHGELDGWSDLAGQPLFTGPAAWDVRAQLDRALAALGVDYRYRELDLALAGGALSQGNIRAMIVYTAGESAPAAWITEAELATELVPLNPSVDEMARLRAAGLEVVAVDAEHFRHAQPGHVHLVPFYYGFHLGLEVDAGDVYRMLEVIEQHAADLAAGDAVFAQLAANMPELQRRGVAATIDSARVHPGLARYMRERGVWDPAWDGRVAE